MKEFFGKIDFIKELGLESLPEKRKEELIQQISKLLQKEIIIYIMETLTDKEKDEFEKFLDEKGKDPAAIVDFLRSKVNLNKIVEEKTKTLLQELKEKFKNL